MDHPKLEEWKTVWRERRSVTMVYILLRISVVLVMLAQIFNGNFENVFLCVLTLILFMMPSVLEKKLDITLPNTLEIIILLFIYAAEIMGEIGAYYVTFPYWDTVLHTMNGFLCAAIGFSLLDILNRHSEARFHLSPLYLAIVAFCFSMTVGVCWEFIECASDLFLAQDMQKDTVVQQIDSVSLDPAQDQNIVRVSGITGIALTKLDVLTGIEKLKICVGYRTEQGEFTESLPANLSLQQRCRPIYEELEGWSEEIRGARRIEELPLNTRRYIQRLEELSGTRLVLVSVGPDRDETIVLNNPFAD